jgi:hypothetical protein
MTLYSGGTTLEVINRYGDVANLLMDIAMSPSQKAALGRVVGAAEDGSSAGHTITVAASAAATTYKRTYVIPLMSFLSSTKMIDLGELLQGFRMEITWAAENVACRKYSSNGTIATNAPTSTYTISDVGLIHTLVELDQSGVAMVNSMKDPVNGTLYFGKSYRYTSMPISAAGEVTIPGNQRLSSITAAFARFRNLSTSTTLNSTASVNPNASYYQWRFGSVVMPQRVVNLDQNDGGYGHAYRNLMSTMNLWSTSSSGCSVGYAAGGNNYYYVREGGAVASNGVIDDATINTGALGGGMFAIGLDTELFSNRSDVLLSGTSTLAAPFYLTLNISATPAATVVADIWAQHDVIMQVRAGQVVVRL